LQTFWVRLVEFAGDAGEEQENGFPFPHGSIALCCPADRSRQALALPVKLRSQSAVVGTTNMLRRHR
jgi:hypothetical protein